ncbi:MAG TPA: molybdenum cofactor biosynthesis protein MoaE [Solirubrobacteraceae bacterium]|jgi:molybdopterin synthase catalytic subunit|nr:molybdenum cofactor biosynthesis protein MoaE [Solirubrobacteraceae bacterium]
MRVSVRLFAILRERAGASSIEIDLPEPATVDDALKALAQRGELSEVMARVPVRMAVNREYAERSSELHGGDELALITPVSGGAQSRVHARICDEPLSLEAVSALVARPAAGAIVSFQGTTRDVRQLDYEGYREMAESQIRSILGQCLAHHGLEAIAAEHRLGSVPLGETSVIVAASAAHRGAAFAGAREAIDRIKAQAPIWKRELEGEGARWVEGVLP